MSKFLLFLPGTQLMTTRALAVIVALAAFGWTAPTFPAPPALQTDRFRVVYEPPKNGAHQELYENLKMRRVLEQFREFLSFIRLPRILTLKLAGCDGDDNAWYEPEDLSVTVCYEYLEGVQGIAPKSVTPGGLTPDNAMLGPLLEVFLHEIGHALFDQLRIPLLGHEEDAADQFAAFVLLHLNEQTAREAMAGVAWMYGQEAKEAKISQSSLANVHGLAGQRFYNTLCMAYGAEPDQFQELIERKLLPEARAEGCEDEYRQVAYAIRALMGQYIDVGTRDKVLERNWAGGKLRKKTATEMAPK